MDPNTPEITHFGTSEGLQYALLDLDEFARCYNLQDKREIEQKGALFVIRKVLKDERLQVSYEENGRPYLRNGVKISISHSFNWLAVLFSRANNVGVDIEKVRDKILRIKEKFLAAAELEELKEATLEKFTVYWCAKEALFKSIGRNGVIFAEELLIEPFDLSDNGGKITAFEILPHSQKKHTLHYRIFPGHVLVYTENH